MRSLIKIAVVSVLFVSVFGCASTPKKYETRVAPPDAFNPTFLKYKALPGQKVMVVAIDPTGQWAFGYDYNQQTLAEAAKNAATKCDKERDKHQVFVKAKLFAVNDEIVYYNNDRK